MNQAERNAFIINLRGAVPWGERTSGETRTTTTILRPTSQGGIPTRVAIFPCQGGQRLGRWTAPTTIPRSNRPRGGKSLPPCPETEGSGWTLTDQSCPARVRTDSSQCCLPASPDGEDAGSEPEWPEQLARPTKTRTPSKGCPGETSPYNQGNVNGDRTLP